ncbi:MAG TPA: hypothetical protein VIM79_07315 [Niastella sp.]
MANHEELLPENGKREERFSVSLLGFKCSVTNPGKKTVLLLIAILLFFIVFLIIISFNGTIL